MSRRNKIVRECLNLVVNARLSFAGLVILITVFTFGIAQAEMFGMDFGHSVAVSDSYTSYRVSFPRIAQHYRNRRLTYRSQITTEIVWIEGEAVWPVTLPLNLGLILLSKLGSQDLQVKWWQIVNAPNSSTELNLDTFNRWKLFGEMRTDYLLLDTSSDEDFKRGIVLYPQVGLQFPVGPLKFRLGGGYSYYWRFAVPNRSLGWTVGFGMYSGVEFTYGR